MNTRYIFWPVFLMSILTICRGNLWAENIDPDNDGSQYAWGENIGWLNFEPSQGDGVHVSKTQITGYVWAENIGWVNLSPSSDGGVVNDGAGNLSGYAWGENVGWISFSCANTGTCGDVDYGATIDSEGNFGGWAWGENIGWIHLASTLPVPYKVQACVVTMDDLKNFAGYWLNSGATTGNLDGDGAGNVNNPDFAIFADYWQDFCPDGWQLK